MYQQSYGWVPLQLKLKSEAPDLSVLTENLPLKTMMLKSEGE